MPDPWPARHFEPESGGVQIPFEYTKGHIFVTVSVNGSPGYEFLLDTGTSINVLDMKASRELGIPIEKIKRSKDLGLGGGKVKVAGARHLKLGMADGHGHHVRIGTAVAIVDLHGLSAAMGRPIDGILGYPLLEKYVLSVNFESDELTFWPEVDYSYRGHGNVMRLVEQGDHVPAIPVTVNTMKSERRQAVVELDTGSDASLLLYPQYAKRTHLDEAFYTSNTKLKPGEGYGLGGCFPVLPAMFSSMRMGNVRVGQFLAFMMRSSPAVTRRKISGVIGTSLLVGYKRVIFDVPHEQVIFELRPPPPATQTAKLGN